MEQQKSTFQSGGELREQGHYNPERLTLARQKNGLTKIQLAKLAEIDVRSVTSYEKAKRPRLAILERIANLLGFPLEFFFAIEPLDVPTQDAVSFRSLARMTASNRDMALAQSALCICLDRYFEEKFEMPPVNVPDLSYIGSPEAAADFLRRDWAIGNRPIGNLVHLLESKGIRIYSLSISSDTVDALSTWRNDTPYVFLNLLKSAEHGRFDAAHELGHLVLHRHSSPGGREAEQEAHAFASAFLMPRASILANAPRFATIDQLEKLKRVWGVSVAALNYRLHSVKMTTDWHYRLLCIEIAKRGLRKREDSGLERESSQVLKKILDTLAKEGISRSDIAKELHISRASLESMLLGLVFATIDGGRKENDAPSSTKTSKLLLVK